MQEPFGLKDHSNHTPVYSIDPVFGMKVDESKAAGKTGYAGQMYYFCSVDCQMKFAENPGLFIGQLR
jgi:YHS domain-containing protein